MILEAPGKPLRVAELPLPSVGIHQLRVAVRACGVCRTDLHVVDGELTEPKLPIIPGHEIVGTVVEKGREVESFEIGDRIGIPWLGYTCGHCQYCSSGRENLCEQARFTGYQMDGGYAEFTVADQRYCFPLPERYSDVEIAPLLCAGLIGYRSLRLAGKAERLGLYGFGAAAHIIAQIALYEGRQVYAFTRAGDTQAQELARELGAVWAGASHEAPPEPLEAAIIFAPVGGLIPVALNTTIRGGTVVCAGIHMSDIPSFPYKLLWGERSIRSVANLTRQDAVEFLELAPKVPIRTEVESYSLLDANEALNKLRDGKIKGDAVLTPGQC